MSNSRANSRQISSIFCIPFKVWAKILYQQHKRNNQKTDHLYYTRHRFSWVFELKYQHRLQRILVIINHLFTEFFTQAVSPPNHCCTLLNQSSFRLIIRTSINHIDLCIIYQSYWFVYHISIILICISYINHIDLYIIYQSYWFVYHISIILICISYINHIDLYIKYINHIDFYIIYQSYWFVYTSWS